MIGDQMANADSRIIPERLQKIFLKILSPLIHLFTKWGISPNAITIAGLIITSLAAGAFMAGKIRLGGILLLIGGLCDTFDGSIARSTGKATRYGAFFDSVIDRYCELVMFFGIAAHFVLIKDFLTSTVIFFALCGSIMVSYCRARAESLGFNANIGIMQRPERIVLLGFGALIHITVLKIAIWLIAILANLTALQRIRYAGKQDANGVEHQDEIDTKNHSRSQ
jgi:CDP-diacylglycerol--glycerol-3-phosphate 3-phosphatidyltransferase